MNERRTPKVLASLQRVWEFGGCVNCAGLTCLAGLFLATSACTLLPRTSSGNRADASATRAQLQHDVMRFADYYVARVAQASDQLNSETGTADARITATRWKLEQGTAFYITAAGENPAFNAIDMVVMATLSRMIVEDCWVGKEFGEAARPLLERHRFLETNSWRLVAEVLSPEQSHDLRDGIARWRLKNPDLRNVGIARSADFLDLARAPTPDSGDLAPTSLLNMVGLDPLSRIDPAVRQIERARFLAERKIYYAERLPKLLSWQAELFLYRLAIEPESRQLLADLSRLTQSAELLGQTAERFPKVANDLREAAINQLFEGIAAERTNLLANLASEEVKVRALLADTRATLHEGGEMADSINTAINSLDTFVRTASPLATNVLLLSTNRATLDIRDYGHAASQVGSMARDMNSLLISATQGAPQAVQLSQQARDDAKEVLNHAFQLGVLLILILAVVSVAAGLLYRMLANRLLTRPRGGA